MLRLSVAALKAYSLMHRRNHKLLLDDRASDSALTLELNRVVVVSHVPGHETGNDLTLLKHHDSFLKLFHQVPLFLLYLLVSGVIVKLSLREWPDQLGICTFDGREVLPGHLQRKVFIELEEPLPRRILPNLLGSELDFTSLNLEIISLHFGLERGFQLLWHQFEKDKTINTDGKWS